MTALAWTRPDSDKPHRCPSCWSSRDRHPHRATGPRSVLRCEPCGLRWRYGSRSSRLSRAQRPAIRVRWGRHSAVVHTARPPQWRGWWR